VYIPHGNNSIVTDFLKITTSSGKTIKLTDTHMVLAGNCQSEPVLRMAKDVRLGNCFLTVDGWFDCYNNNYNN
jgi:hypothetical protein